MDWMRMLRLVSKPTVLAVIGTTGLVAGYASASQSVDRRRVGDNIARGAKYVVSPKPTYQHCTDPGDATQLTDGQLTEGYFWTQEGTVGWRGAQHVTITVDLGRIEPIAGVSFRTAAGMAGVFWPAAIRIHVSDDGKTYRDVGDLVALDKSGGPPPEKYAVHRFVTSQLKTRGRHLRLLVIPCGPYVFTDEIEVFRGPDAMRHADPGGEPVGKIEESYYQHRVESGIRRRFRRDVHDMEQAVRQAKLTEAARERLLSRLSKVRKEMTKISKVSSPSSFRAVLPLNETHAQLFRIQAALWSALRRPVLSAWATSAWDPLDPFGPIPSAPSGGIEVHTMRREYRSGALNLANAGDRPMRVSIRFTGIAGSPVPKWVTVHEVAWTDTVSGQPVAAALPYAERGDGAWWINALPGLVRQIWFTFHVTDLGAGEHVGSIVVKAEGIDEIALPIRLHVYPLSFPATTTLWVGGWSYTDGQGARGVTPENRSQLIAHLRNRFVNAPWATSQVMMRFTLKDEDPPAMVLDAACFDEWIEQWPDAKAYLVFLSVGNTFAGAQIGTQAFKQRVGVWISAWVRHLQKKGIQPDQVGLLLVDEPRAHHQDDVIIAWAKAIRAAEPRVLIWEDPVYRNPAQARPELFEVCHILCPNRPMWLSAGKEFGEFYLGQQKRGRTLQLYSCSGPARLLDPYAYYRLQAWHCWQIGATGSFFWSFGDTGRTSSWNEYAAASGPWTPEFLDDRSVTPAKQMEAIRESAEDYEYFVMLREAVNQASAAGKTRNAANKARSLLETAANEVLSGEGVNELTWHTPKDRTKADAVRVRLLEALTELQPAE